MTNPKPDIRRLRLALALEKLSPALRADVLADGTIVARFDVPAKRPAQLLETVTVRRDDLFTAFRSAAEGIPPPPILDLDGHTVDAKISIDPNGAGIVEIGEKRLRFTQAALLSSDPARRLAYLETALRQCPLTRRDADFLRAAVAKSDYGDNDFFSAVTLLATSPQAFVDTLQEKLRAQDSHHRIGREDVSLGTPDGPRRALHHLERLHR